MWCFLWNSVALLTCQWPNHIQPWNSVALLTCASSYKLLIQSGKYRKFVGKNCHCGKWLQIEDLFLICFHQDLCSRLQICSCNVCCARTSVNVITWEQKNLGYWSAKMWWSMGCPENLICSSTMYFLAEIQVPVYWSTQIRIIKLFL